MKSPDLIEYGQGPKTVVLVHGGPSLFGYMSSLGQLLAPHFRVVEYAQRGTYESPAEDSELTIHNHVADLQAVIATCSAPVILMGHSWGAAVALLYAAAQPLVVEKVILLSMAPLEATTAEKFSANLQGKLSPSELAALAQIKEQVSRTQNASEINSLMEERLKIISPAYHYRPESESLLPKSRWNYQSFCISYDSLWDLIESGELKTRLENIHDEVVEIHGEADSIPIADTFEF